MKFLISASVINPRYIAQTIVSNHLIINGVNKTALIDHFYFSNVFRLIVRVLHVYSNGG